MTRSTSRGSSPRRKLSTGWIVLIATLTALAVLAYLWRPLALIHGTVMFFYMQPLLTLGLIMAAGFAVAAMIMPPIKSASARTYSQSFKLTLASKLMFTAAAFFALFALYGVCTQSSYNARALYGATDYKSIAELPKSGVVRVMPKQVADTIAINSFNSPTETLKNSHIVRESDGKLHWTYEQAPSGAWRTLTKQTGGAIGVEATAAESDITSYDGKFAVGPSMKFSDSIRWRVYKKHYLARVTEIFAIPQDDGTVIFAAPYVKYKGLLTKRPYFAGVMMVSPDGSIEDLSPAEAAKRGKLAESGRLFPEQLTRQIHDAYAYRHGIMNKIFTHRDQTEVHDPDSDNRQPFMLAFGDTLKWVSVAEPHGKAYAANAVFLTDAVTGKTQIWHVPKSTTYAGPTKGLDAAAGRAYSGIVFGKGSGKFRAVEPRPVFFDGKLHYLVSIIPNRKTLVTKSVIVDADRNKVVAVFDHDTDDGATDKLLKALETGELPTVSVGTGGEALDEGASATEQIQQLLNENRQALVEANERQAKIDELVQQLLAEQPAAAKDKLAVDDNAVEPDA